MKTIWKYPIHPDTTLLSMPAGAKVLCVQTQNNEPYIWALVDPAAMKIDRYFSIYGTGHGIPLYPGSYIGTWQADDLVWHLFEGPR